MRSQAVLVLGSYANCDLIELFFSAGFSPLVREDIQGALDKLRYEQFAAVVVDQVCAKADVLEFILNVRDIDEQIPVVVLGPLKDETITKMLLNQNHTVVLREVESSAKLTKELERILSIGEDKNG